MQSTIGNRALQRLLRNDARVPGPGMAATTLSSSRRAIQTKLAVNQAGDEYEQEAERIADQVMATNTHHAPAGVPPALQRFAGPDSGGMAEAPASVDQALSGTGSPLEPALRKDMERRFVQDFSAVRVHSGPEAEKSARDVNASAYTSGHDIVFGAGQYDPQSSSGRWLLAHELAHVLQQTGSDGNRLGHHHSDLRIARWPPPGGGPSVPTPAAVSQLKGLGLDAAKIDAFGRGEPVIFEMPVKGGTPTIGILQLKPGLLRGGIFSINVPGDKKAAVAAFFSFRQPVLNLASALGLKEIELFGAAIHDQKIDEMLTRQGFVRSTEIIPESFGMGPADKVEVLSKRFPVPEVTPSGGGGGGGGEPPVGGSPGGGGAPPAGGAPPVGGAPPTTAKTQTGVTEEPPAIPGTPTPAAETPPAEMEGGVPLPGKPALPGGGMPPTGGWQTAKGVAYSVGPTVFSLILSYFGGKIIGAMNDRRIKKAMEEMAPQIQMEIEKRKDEVSKLLQQTNMQKTIYANIKVDVIYSFMIDPDGPPMIDYQDTKLVGVDVSAEYIEKEDWEREQMGIAGHDDHHIYTYSVPLAAPAALVLPVIDNVHTMLARIRHDLAAQHGGTAGEAVALDYLDVALQATDTTKASALQDKPPVERFNSTVEAITHSISVLEGREEPALVDLRQRLEGLKFLVNGALGNRWPVMVQ